ncbi:MULTISPECIES: cytochrome P450 [Sorangium]|uniref:Cytochrome P450 n=1 Tax=Sorangium cellulosum TaxID=56 RepID=A0A4V0NF05_SORCE|nr:MULTISPECIES: cytochrome P450 [Sorangium]AUX27992.1 cytochrome P450 [Sorangium cellulosum]WCQ87397.1 Pentalenene oxygenase [Sorangium sp. Soce836]
MALNTEIDPATFPGSQAPVYARMPPLAEGGLPLLGSLPALLSQQAEFFPRARMRHGDVYRLRLGPLSMIVVNHPRHVQHVLRDHSSKYGKGGALWDSLRTLLGNGLGVSEGDYWLRQRRMMQPHFHRERVDQLAGVMVDAIDDELEIWDVAARTGSPLDPMRAVSPLVMKLIARALFGGDINREEIELVTARVTFAINYVFRGIVAQELPAWLPVPGRRRYQQAIRDMDAVLLKIIERSQRRQQRAGDRGGLLAMLVSGVDPETGRRMTASELRDEVVNLFLAGYETTAVALAWTLQLLLHEPAVMAELRAEVDSVVGRDRPDASHLAKLSYTRMVFQESLRVRPPLWWLVRVAVVDDEIDGFHVPAGTLVLAPTYAIHRHPELWEDPDRFDPGRFTPERAASRHKLAWIPFGTGQRQCIGSTFALAEAQLILARLVQRYTFAAGLPRRKVVPALSMALHMKNGTPFRVTRRSPA